MATLNETDLKLFVDSIRHYLKVTTRQEPQITSAYLGTGDIEGFEFNGIVAFLRQPQRPCDGLHAGQAGARDFAAAA